MLNIESIKKTLRFQQIKMFVTVQYNPHEKQWITILTNEKRTKMLINGPSK
jgi:hypothetical protein